MRDFSLLAFNRVGHLFGGVDFKHSKDPQMRPDHEREREKVDEYCLTSVVNLATRVAPREVVHAK